MPKEKMFEGIDYERTIFNPRWFMENLLYIVDKAGRTIPFKLNREQRRMMEHIEFCLANDIPIRMILLKARQIGATTFFTGFGFWCAAMNRNTNYGIVAHRLDSAQSIFDKTKMFYNFLPRELRPATIQFSSEAIKFDKKDGTGINSMIQFATAGEGVFRGQTLRYLHKSESAFWDGDIDLINSSLAPTVPDVPGTIIVNESTANGYNHFKEEWDRAVRGESGYAPFFFGWQDHEEYRLEVPYGFELTEEEARLKERFNLTDEQIAWRRKKISDDYHGNELYFQQEYPMTPEEAFLASGAGVFDAKTIKAGYEASKEPKLKKEIKSYITPEKLLIWEEPQEMVEEIRSKKAVWSVEKQAYEYEETDLVLETIKKKVPYSIGIDTAGLGKDWNQIVVINNLTKKYAARFGQKDIPEDALADIAIEIAEYYNNAMIAPETNFSKEICNYILKPKFDENGGKIRDGYKNVYMTENLAKTKKVSVGGGVEYGWKTTGSTKAPMISALRALLKDHPELIEDREFWYQAEYFLITDIAKNKMEAAGGHFDDIIIAAAIAHYVSCSFQAPQTPIIFKEEKVQKSGWINGIYIPKKKKLRKGIYKNHA